MKSLVSCLARICADGYTEDFTVNANGMAPSHGERRYSPAEVRINSFFRFEGKSDPAGNAILYVIETTDGTRGTLVDSYGTYGDAFVARFMEDVILHKKGAIA